MFRCLVGTGTESTPGARAGEAAKLVSQFVGDLCVVALASEDRRRFGPFAVESRDPRMTAAMREAVDQAEPERAAWPLAGRALISGVPVVIDRIRPGELEGVVNPAMDRYLADFGLSAIAFVPMRASDGSVRGIVGMGRGPGRPAYTPEELDAVQLIADGAADEGAPGGLLTMLLRRDDLERGLRGVERRFRTLVERLPAIVYEAEPGAEGQWLYVSGFVETLLGYTPAEWREDPHLWSACVHDEDREAVLAAEERLSARGADRDRVPHARARRQRGVGPRRVLAGDRRGRAADGRGPADGHHRPQGGRGAPPAPRRPRRAHQPAQPPPLPRGARAGDRGDAARDALERGDDHRRRRLQVRQRLARPPGGRRPDPDRRPHARRDGCAPATRSRASAATSSPACCAGPAPRRPRPSPRSCSGRCATSASPPARRRCASRPAPASPR